MNENEAIEELKTSIDLAQMCTQNLERKREVQGYEIAIKALEEVQQYRQIGTVEECREAVEKQTAKKISSAWCPSCKKYLTMQHLKGKYHCVYCGQKLDWSDEE